MQNGSFRGTKRPETIQEYAQIVANNHVVLGLFNLRWTTIFHCKWDSNIRPVCKIATEEKFFCANGITISPDGNTIFVNDVLGLNIVALSRNLESGVLTKQFDIQLPSIVDNIEYDDEANEIILGNIIPGGMAVASPPLANEASDTWKVKGVLKHDETKLKQISVAARMGTSKIILGSPFAEGVLVCSN